MCWGFLPCGLIYSALAWSATAASASYSAALMVAFGLGTLPMMLATGGAAQWLVEKLGNRWFRKVAALLLLGFGAWTLVNTWNGWLPGSSAGSHHHHVQNL